MKKIIFLAVLLVFPFLIFGEVQTLSLNEARELALRNSRSLARLNLSVQSAVLNEKTLGFDKLPNLSLRASAGTVLFDWENGTSPDIIRDNIKASVTASVTQKLWDWDGGIASIRKAIAGLNTESARQSALAEYYSVLNTVDSLYYSVLEAQAGLEAAENSLKTAELGLSIAEIRRQNRMISEIDYLRALADKESRETSRNQSRRDLSVAWLRFNNLTGINTQIVLEPVDFDSLEALIETLARIDDAGFDRLYARFRSGIEQRNPGFINAGIRYNISEKSMESVKREYSPVLGASLSTGLGYNIERGINSNALELTLSASIPLDFWVTNAKIESQRIALSQASLTYRDAMEALDIELKICLLNLISQAGQTLSSKRALEHTTLSFDHVLELYRLGQNSQTALSDAELLLRNSRNQFDRTRFGFLSALSALRSLGAFDSGGEIALLSAELGINLE